jgi:hypothetical protein
MTPPVHRKERRVMSEERPDRRRFAQGSIARFIVLAVVLLLCANSLFGQSGDALFINEQGNVGIGTRTPGFPLTFPNSLGDKVSLWGQSGALFGEQQKPGGRFLKCFGITGD